MAITFFNHRRFIVRKKPQLPSSAEIFKKAKKDSGQKNIPLF
jgi:hypothetical protein